MKKAVIMLIALMVVSVGFLSGCTETNDKEIKKEDFIGTWQMVDTSFPNIKDLLNVHDYIYEFLENGTIKISEIHYNDPDNLSDAYMRINWNNWNVSEGKLHMGNETIMSPYDYQFSSNNNELTLSNSQNGWSKYIKKS